MISRARAKVSTLVGDRSSAFDLARGRLVLLSGLFMLAYMMLAARAIDLTVIQGNAGSIDQQMVENEDTVVPISVPRADITDRNGVLLATTLKTETLYADPHLLSSIEKVAMGLVNIFPEIFYGDVFAKLQSGKRFIPIRRDLTPEEQYAVLELGEPGLAFQQKDRRVYPQGKLTAHMVGFSSTDLKGLAGVERSFDKALNAGEPLRLTLDIRLQHVMRRELNKALKDFNGIGAAGVILDAGSGEILAGVSLPDFDPNEAGDADKTEIFNRLTLGAYELGSVFKIFSLAAFFETHDVPFSTTFDASQPLKVGKFTITDYHAENRILTIPEVFMYSSNIGAAEMGQKVGSERLKNFYEDLGLLTPLDFEISEVARPQVPNPWRDVNTVTAAFGHGIATTPLQVASAVASIMNGGILVRPHLVMKDREESSGMRVVSEKTAHRMRQLMRLAVTDGTGEKADVPGYDIGGKTGTAEKNSFGRYDHDRLISSFAAAFPIDAPKYVIFVMVDEPKGNQLSRENATAGWVAAPAAARIVTGIAAILGIPPQNMQKDLGSSLKQYVSAKAHE